MTFEAALLELTGRAADTFDIRATTRRCFFYDFDGQPVRLWDGQGILQTTSEVGDPVEMEKGTLAANEWLGTIDAGGTNHHQVPAVKDSRDGSSPRYNFSLPYLDAVTFAALKADQELARGRNVTCYYALIKGNEGLLPLTPLHFSWRMRMYDVNFSQGFEAVGGTTRRVYSVSVLARTLEHGRSRVPSGLMTDTAQNERARLLGLSSDSGCSFVAANSNRTYVVGG